MTYDSTSLPPVVTTMTMTTTSVYNMSADIQSTDVMPLSDDVMMTSRTPMPLWVPYVALTVVLLLLIIISFTRFHVLRVLETQ